MAFDWLTWSNPLTIWWYFLVSVSFFNILFWIWTKKFLTVQFDRETQEFRLSRTVVSLSLLYVFGCAFRSILPRADVQRICLFDTWFSNVFIGRTVATVAELAFVAQWSLVLFTIAKIVNSPKIQKLSILVVPLIFIAECFSWFAVVTTNYLGNTIEESIWAITYLLIAICLAGLWPKFKGALRFLVGVTFIGVLIYVVFMFSVDVPMYFNRWRADIATGKIHFGFSEGIYDLLQRWVVTRNIDDWKDEIPWMSLYFSAAVWASLALCFVPLSFERLKKHLNLGSSFQ
jgi:hypothetical protein